MKGEGWISVERAELQRFFISQIICPCDEMLPLCVSLNCHFIIFTFYNIF